LSSIYTPVDTSNVHRELARAWALACTGRSAEAMDLALGLKQTCIDLQLDDLAARCDSDIAFYCFQLGVPLQGIGHARDAAIHWAASGNVLQQARARAHYG